MIPSWLLAEIPNQAMLALPQICRVVFKFKLLFMHIPWANCISRDCRTELLEQHLLSWAAGPSPNSVFVTVHYWLFVAIP